MTDSASTLYISFSAIANEPLYWWHVGDGILLSQGLDHDPLIAAEQNHQIDNDGPMTIVALVPSAAVVVLWHNEISDITEKQARAAALIAARKVSLQPQICHVASIADSHGQIVTATMDQQLLTDGLADLNVRGIDPDIVSPSGWLVPSGNNGPKAIDFGFDKLLRTEQMIVPDEPDFRQYFIGHADIEQIDEDGIGKILANAEISALLNLRSGGFVKKANTLISARQKKSLIWLVAALIIASLAISFVQWARYQWATASADDQARAALLPIIGEVADLDEGEGLLDQKLVAENRGNVIFSVPASALFSAVQQVPGVSIGRLSYRQDGLVAAELSAVRNEDINPALITMQKAGFKITATPRTDATGTAKADITVRAP